MVVNQSTPRRILIDTNVLLDAIFVPESPAHTLLFDPRAAQLQPRLLMTSVVLGEAEARVQRAGAALAVSLGAVVNTAVSQRRFVVVDAAALPVARHHGINRADSAIVDAALALGADICTKDIGDIQGAMVLGVRVTTPRQLIDSLGIGLDSIFHGFMATPFIGTWFFDGGIDVLDSPAIQATKEIYYVFDQEGLGGLYLDCATRQLVFTLDWGPSVRLAVPPGNAVNMCVTYRAGERMVMQMGVDGPEASIMMPRPNLSARVGSIQIGQHRTGEHHISAHYTNASSLNLYLASRRARNNLLSGVATPNAWERLSVEDAIRRSI